MRRRSVRQNVEIGAVDIILEVEFPILKAGHRNQVGMTQIEDRTCPKRVLVLLVVAASASTRAL